MTNLLLIISLLSTLSCQSSAPTATDVPPRKPLIGFTQHGCRGFCPSYQLTIYQNGLVEYEGLRNVKLMGKTTIKLTAKELRRVQAAVKRTNVWKYPEQIESQVADAPTATLTGYRSDGRKHDVTGSIDRPAPLLALENLIKDVVEAHGIALREGVDPNAPTGQETYVSVLLRSGVNAGNWIGRFQELRLRLVRRLGEENRWVVSYDPKETTESAIIKMLSGMEDVLEVKPYR